MENSKKIQNLFQTQQNLTSSSLEKQNKIEDQSDDEEKKALFNEEEIKEAFNTLANSNGKYITREVGKKYNK